MSLRYQHSCTRVRYNGVTVIADADDPFKNPHQPERSQEVEYLILWLAGSVALNLLLGGMYNRERRQRQQAQQTARRYSQALQTMNSVQGTDFTNGSSILTWIMTGVFFFILVYAFTS